jgi:carboxymethylenebutenolidase
MADQITFALKDGSHVGGAIALPPGGDKAPALVLIQEWWGLNNHIRGFADRFAAAGFLTLSPDLYHGKATTDANEAGKLMAELDSERALRDIAGAVRFLLAHERSNGKVGITGFCMGGALSFAAAASIPEISAAVPFYGIPPADKTDYTQLKAPILAHFASRDEWATVASAEALKKHLEARGKSMQLHVYEADHAFMNDTRPEVYNAEAAKLAWERTLAFLRTQLDTGGSASRH